MSSHNLSCTCTRQPIQQSRLTYKPQLCDVCTNARIVETNERDKNSKRSSRKAMTETERLQELATSKRRRSKQPQPEVDAIDSVSQLLENYTSVEERVYQLDSKNLSAEAMEELVCCVCDCFHVKSKVKAELFDAHSTLIRAAKTRLKPPPILPAGIQMFYGVSDIDLGLRGLLLSRAGINISDDQLVLQMRSSCRTSLLDPKRTNPPKYAIANGLYIGQLPACLEDTTFTENAMLNLSQPMHFISVVRGGKHASLRSHTYFFRADPAPPAELLPRDVVSEGVIGMTMVGASTPAQKAAILKKYDVRVQRPRQHLDWYQGNNQTVVAITPAKDDTVQVRVANGIEEHSHTLPPDIIYVKLKDYGSHLFDASLPLGVVPICRRLETGVSIKMSHRSFSVSISQVPLVLAYSLTTGKCQGLTVDKMILAPLRHPTRRIPQRSSFYVAVTRVKTLPQLYLMAPLTKQFLEYFKPSQEALEENRRLQAIEDEQVY